MDRALKGGRDLLPFYASKASLLLLSTITPCPFTDLDMILVWAFPNNIQTNCDLMNQHITLLFKVKVLID